MQTSDVPVGAGGWSSAWLSNLDYLILTTLDYPPAMSSSEETTTVENWAEYSDALVDRGRLTIWISEEAIQDWKADREPQQGAQWIFTDGAIETCLQIKMVYGLTLRGTEGFVESLFALFAF